MQNIAILLACITLGSLAIIAYAIYLLGKVNQPNKTEGRKPPIFTPKPTHIKDAEKAIEEALHHENQSPNQPQIPTVKQAKPTKPQPVMDEMADVERRFHNLADKD